MWSRADVFGALAFIAAAALAPAMPAWLVSLATIAFANALVVLGLIILWRTGLVPFGQALFYATGAYAVALLGRYTPIRDVFAVVFAGGLCAAFVAFLVGFLLARYREIFFAMLSLAMSMILYGVLVKTEALGSTDGFHVEAGTFFGYRPHGDALNLSMYWLTLGFGAAAACFVSLYFRTVAGALAIPVRDNEIRVEFLGISVNRLIHLKLVIAATLAGIGGALAALAVAHVDPNMAYWTTSGGFVFVTILAGTASVAAAFVASFVFELVRSIAVDILPNTWQIILGSALLLTILFLPDGLGSLFQRLAQTRKSTEKVPEKTGGKAAERAAE
jgi:ABC-type branched-subunit amino acid transport system permease subunit